MDTLEFKPKFFNPLSVIYLIAAIIVTSILSISVWPRLYELYLLDPEIPGLSKIIIATSASILVVWGIYFLSLVASLGKKIKIENNLVYFIKRKFMGFGAWNIERILNFAKVTEITQREKKFFNGKVIVILYYLIFHMTDGSKQELLVNDWDRASVHELFLYIKGRHPDMKFNTIVLKDSPERISGLDKYLTK